MTVLNTAKQHFKEIANKGTAHIDIPEWGTVVYWNISGLNFAQQSKVIELQQSGKSAEALVEMMIMRAMDADGKRMFKLAEKTEIMREVDPNMILKVVTAMGDSDTEADDELSDPVKN
tara:strand:- start:215 stop:568 length:354 start_codon:yes stop_codon:yes gene_type:complete